MKSIIQDDTDYCFVCGRYGTELHHILFGKGNNRKLADHYGLTCGLCYNHHRGSKGAHFNRELDLELKKIAQQKFEEVYPDLDFLAIFGRNYLF
jgi:hypothetical protein